MRPIAFMRLRHMDHPDDVLKRYSSKELVVEQKYDGFKIMATRSRGMVRLYSRNGKDLTGNAPSVVNRLEKILPENTSVLGEMVYIQAGNQELGPVQSILHSGSSARAIKQARNLGGRLEFIVYDCIEYDGKSIAGKPWIYRRSKVEYIVPARGVVRTSKIYTWSKRDRAMLESIRTGGEGIVIKVKDSPYLFRKSGSSEPHGWWWKYKVPGEKSHTEDVILHGYKKREKRLAFEMYQIDSGKRVFVGYISNLPRATEKEVQKISDRGGSVVAEISYQERLPTGKFRHPGWVRLRPDKPFKSATMTQSALSMKAKSRKAKAASEKRRVTSNQVHLVPTRGSSGRGGGPGGESWRIEVDGKRAGTVFINAIDEPPLGCHASIQIFLNSASQGRGIGRIAYRLATEASAYDEVYAHMRKSNIASRRAAEEAGFIPALVPGQRQLIMVHHRKPMKSKKAKANSSREFLDAMDVHFGRTKNRHPNPRPSKVKDALAAEATRFKDFDQFANAYWNACARGIYWYPTDDKRFYIGEHERRLIESGRFNVSCSPELALSGKNEGKKYVAELDVTRVPEDSIRMKRGEAGSVIKVVGAPGSVKVARVLDADAARRSFLWQLSILPSSKEGLRKVWERAWAKRRQAAAVQAVRSQKEQEREEKRAAAKRAKEKVYAERHARKKLAEAEKKKRAAARRAAAKKKAARKEERSREAKAIKAKRSTKKAVKKPAKSGKKVRAERIPTSTHQVRNPSRKDTRTVPFNVNVPEY